MASITSLLLIATAFTSTVLGHGVVTDVQADGKSYKGYNPWAYKEHTDPTIGWRIPAYPKNPYVLPAGYKSQDIICHNGATNADQSVTIGAGGKLGLTWSNPWPKSHHGPVITSLANCRGKCSEVDKSTLEFVVIEAVGLIANSTNPAEKAGHYASDDLIAQGSKWSVEIPSDIAQGEYICRHEIIALHGANASGAQNYPQCINLIITGSGTDDLTTGGTLGVDLYGANDPGIHIDIYQNIDYKIPGPPVRGSGGNKATQTPTTKAPTIAKPDANAKVDTPKKDTDVEVDTPKKDTPAAPHPSVTAPVYYNISGPATPHPKDTTTDNTKPADSTTHLTPKGADGKPVENNTPQENYVKDTHTPLPIQDKHSTTSTTGTGSGSGGTECAAGGLNIPDDATVPQLLDSLDRIDELLKQKLVGKTKRMHARDVVKHL